MKENCPEKIYDQIVKYSDLTNKNILEIGCGNGRISSLLSVESDTFIAIDPDSIKIKQAHTHIPGVDFRVGSGQNLNFPDSFFDIVIFTLSLHHQNSQKAMSEASRVLKQSGKILVIEPRVEGEVEQVFSFLQNENNEKLRAQKAVDDSGLLIVDSNIFTAEWIFNDKDDLLQSVFHRYDMVFDTDISLKILKFVGDKIHNSPIVLIDTMIIHSLSKITG